MKITNYFVVHTEFLSDLKLQVISWMNQGWQPLGGVSVTRGGYYQAMVKYGNNT